MLKLKAEANSGNLISMENRFVCFSVSDIYSPESSKVLKDLFDREVLKGKLIDFTSNGTRGELFAIVKVEGLNYPLIVPAARTSASEAD